MKKRILLAAFLASALLSVPAYAGEWKEDSAGWWYQNDDGSYPVNSWQWIDGNNDGIAECYYFDPSGYCLMNTTTPDGYMVDSSGAYVVDGIVQTQAITLAHAPAQDDSAVQSSQVVYWTPGGKSYHKSADCPTLSRSTTILSGNINECPKVDPCNVCIGG